MGTKVVKVLGFTARGGQLAIKTANSSFTLRNNNELLDRMVLESEEFLLARLAVSIHTVGKYLGKLYSIDLRSIQIEVAGELSQADKAVAFPFRKVNVVVKPNTEGSIIELKNWMDELKKRCPVFESFRKQIPTLLTLIKEYEEVKVA